ncbi:sulfotransferase family cytosolic 1B member 1-like [Drosophila busckii]|uniref:sulfotransferase family cytosolic 1B member 1-like n=1 Tax=Drosophila busckii TaxID=30019 RepID=UPI00083EDA3A|nr:sulfotransferase family cytosolic 1B member 1-like [Drosophila busckii]
MFVSEEVKSSDNVHMIRLRKEVVDSINNGLIQQQDWQIRWCTMPKHYLDASPERVDEFTTRDDDVFVVTFPKSGTTWMQELAWLLLNQLDFERAKSSYAMERSIFLEHSLLHPTLAMDTIKACDEQASPRLIKSHLPAPLLPSEIWQHKRKTIYVARNPKDVVVSSYHFWRGIGVWTGLDFDKFVEDFMFNKISYASYWAHIIDFWKMRNEANIFFVTYEQMKCDLKSVIERLQKFLEVQSLNEDSMEKLLNHLSFQNMKESKYTNLTGFLKTIDNTTDDFEFMRRGIVGAYNDELSEAQKQKLDDWTAEFLLEYNLKESDIFGQL